MYEEFHSRGLLTWVYASTPDHWYVDLPGVCEPIHPRRALGGVCGAVVSVWRADQELDCCAYASSGRPSVSLGGSSTNLQHLVAPGQQSSYSWTT